MLLRHSLGLEKEAAAVESAVESVLEAGLRTSDLALADTASALKVGTVAMGKAVADALRGGR